jgi:hypothetical protein
MKPREVLKRFIDTQFDAEHKGMLLLQIADIKWAAREALKEPDEVLLLIADETKDEDTRIRAQEEINVQRQYNG